MHSFALIGAVIVQFAIISYSIGIITEQRTHRISKKVMRWLTAGVIFDILATACMVAGSTSGLLTVHGAIGFSALAAMLLEITLAYRHRRDHGDDEVPRSLHLYSRFAFLWWVVAYVGGFLLVMANRSGN